MSQQTIGERRDQARLINALERIASALERIAEQTAAPTK